MKNEQNKEKSVKIDQQKHQKTKVIKVTKENLDRQKDRLMKYAEKKDYKYIVIDEIASGINEKRKGLHRLIKLSFEGKVERVFIRTDKVFN
ncbi:MAG: recombinase family protein [Bacilli bacterium]|nr:recombinase family protein [Bacilli bacterium]